MDAEHKDEEAIFKAAFKLKSPTERAAYLKKACGNDANLLARVEALLKAYNEAGNFLESGPPGVDGTLDAGSLSEGPGTRIGRYKLLELIGEGGFGVVYMAQQEEPIRRRVALKIIKLGMDTKQVIARFEAERQALAMMEHPNIAKVLDAGATDTGRPYFVMELVKGIPITEYCDKNNLDTRQRLELFIDVCKAVQHAHQKGIIHRDIKPTNVMITLRDDGTGVPKIIDFGIAKATQHRLTEKTFFTEYRQLIGTPEYMSPEQAQMGEVDVDTRSDIYSLGVLLYELLTGTTPFEAEELRSAAYDEMLKTIRETEPPKPSTRLNTLGDALSDIAKHRNIQPGQLCKIIRGELDWIVLKTLEKDRTRRYETANELAMDVERHLSHEPVVAGPPSTIYRLRKFVRRNRALVTSVAVVLVVLVGGIVASTIFAVGQARARAEADFEYQRASVNFQIARDAVDEMTQVVEERLANIMGTEQVRRELLQKAQVFYAGFAEQNKDDPAVRKEIALAYHRVGEIHGELGNFSQAREALREAISLLETLKAEFPDEPEYRVELAYCWFGYGYTFIWTHRKHEMVQAQNEQMALWQELVADFPTVPEYRIGLAEAHTHLGNSLQMVSRLNEAEMHLKQSLSVLQELHTDFPEMPKNLDRLSHSHHWLGAHLLGDGELEEAEEHLREALELREQLLAEDPNDPWHRGCLAYIKLYIGSLLLDQGKAEEAEKEYRESIAIHEKLIEEFPGYVEHRRRLGHTLRPLSDLLRDRGRVQEAEDALREAVFHWEKLVGDHPEVDDFRDSLAGCLVELGNLLRDTGQVEGAEEAYKCAEEIRKEAIRE